MLTHGNLAADAYASCRNVFLEGASLLVLPLHHAFGLVAGVYCEMMYGCTVCINRSLKSLDRDLLKYRPSHLFIVPLMAEQFRRKILGADLRSSASAGVREAFGGNLNLLVSGGAAIDDGLVRWFSALGIKLLNGYGITECGPVVAVNRNEQVVPGSVGLPLECNAVRILDGEILVKGDNVMSGYYRMPEETEAAFTDGWFRTGDLGRIDRSGALHITGRIKNLIILKNGENIPAESLEAKLAAIPGVAEVLVFARNDVIAAEIYPDPAGADTARIRERLARVNAGLPQNMNVTDVIFRDAPFPKTSTKKIIRDRRI